MTKHRRTVSVRRWAVVLLASGLASVGACVASDFADGQFACDPHGAAFCPPGLLCARDGLCRTRDLVGGGADGAVDGEVVAEGGADAPDFDANEAGADACTTATWAFASNVRLPSSVALDSDGRLFTAGQFQNLPWVAELDTCDGGIIREHTFPVSGADGGSFNDVFATTASLFVCGGAQAPNAIDGTVDKSLATASLSTVTGTNYTGLSRIAVGTDGAVWAYGQKKAFETPSEGWVVRVTPPSCEATLGVSVAVTQAPGGSMYAMVDSTAVTSQVMLLSSACVPGATVGPALSLGGFAIGTASIFVQGNVLYASGTVQVTSAPNLNRYVFLAALDLTTKKWTVSKLDPNPGEPDIVQEAVTDAKSIFLGVTQRAGFGTGTGTIYRYDPPYTSTSVPAMTTLLAFGGMQVPIRSIAVSPPGQDAVYAAAGSINGIAGVARCRKSGQCTQ